ncbi:hypothetical protein MTO96_013985 [Rhipicephalus appendiculatus]
MGSTVLQLLLLLAAGAAWAADDRQVYTCNATQLLSPELVAEIRSYAPVVQNIIDYVLRGPERNRTYEELAKFVDRFGARISGSRNLENAIDYMVELLGRQELDRVYTERVAVPHWVRGNESAWIVRPRMQKLNMLGLGGSVGTSPSGITAPILVVRSFEELQSNASKARGKVVVFDEEFVSYGRTVEYRENGAAAAERVGAVAALVRSVTPFSIGSPHTGWMNYQRGEPRIPCASITCRGRAVAPKAPGQRRETSGKRLFCMAHPLIGHVQKAVHPLQPGIHLCLVSVANHPFRECIVPGHWRYPGTSSEPRYGPYASIL